jgi:hypothetical protein
VPRIRLTYSNIAATLALLVAIGGSAYAAANVRKSDVRAGTRGARILESNSGDGSIAQLTHYRFGTTIRTMGRKSGIFEFFLGDKHAPGAQLSVRNNGNGAGASVQARNAADTSGLVVDFGRRLRPALHIEDAGDLVGAVLGIENPQKDGSIAFATKTNGSLVDHVVLDSKGHLRSDGDVHFGNDANDKVVFHGAAGSGKQGNDPGLLRVGLTATDLRSPARIATLINENRRVINSLRDALRAQGLVK